MTLPTEELRPLYFITRSNGKMVPLIALDELPGHVIIQGLSTNMTSFDTTGMTSLGLVPSRHRQYAVDVVTARPFTRSNALPSESATSSNSSTISPDANTAQCDLTPRANNCGQTKDTFAANLAYAIAEQAPATLLPSLPTSASSSRADRNAGPSQPVPLPDWKQTSVLPPGPAPGVKKYCSYWMRNGECDYAQQGCLYLHEMPTDLRTLSGLGFRDIPRWYRELHGLGSWHAQQPINKKTVIMGQDWRGGVASGRASQKPGVSRTRRVIEDTPFSSPTIQPATMNGTRFPSLANIPSSNTLGSRRPTSEAHHEALRAAQVQRSLIELDNQEALLKDRDALAKKYTILQPGKENVDEITSNTKIGTDTASTASANPSSSSNTPSLRLSTVNPTINNNHLLNVDGPTKVLSGDSSSTTSHGADAGSHTASPTDDSDELESLLRTETDAEMDTYVDRRSEEAHVKAEILSAEILKQERAERLVANGYGGRSMDGGNGGNGGNGGKRHTRRPVRTRGRGTVNGEAKRHSSRV